MAQETNDAAVFTFWFGIIILSISIGHLTDAAYGWIFFGAINVIVGLAAVIAESK